MEPCRNTDKQKQHTFELLAPAGSFEIFKAVIAAGADAVYVGGSMFGARAYADNFSTDELLMAIDYAHLYSRKIYLTVNTLLKNSEIKQLFDYLLPYYERGLDAVLVQDLGVFQFIKDNFPGLPIHTSTQMTVTSAEDAEFLKSLGAERIVLARELSLSEMRQIHDKTGMELEAFVHGAHCYSYSGQCLFSSILGGRSGNRGRCAQPCRLPYTLSDKSQTLHESYVLSLKDLCGISDLNKLYNAGVYSLKIEGRMKQLAYAAGVVSVYRKYIDKFLEHPDAGYQISENDKKTLFHLGNRCGFTNGYYHQKPGKDMVTFEKPSYEKTNESLQKRIEETYRDCSKIEVDAKICLQKKQPAFLELGVGQTNVCVNGMSVMEAKTNPLAEEAVRRRITKTGDTPFCIRNLDVKLDEGVFLPNSALNQIRRDAFGKLEHQLLKQYYREHNTADEIIPNPYSGITSAHKQINRIICLTEERSLLPQILNRTFVTTVCLDYGAYNGLQISALSEDTAAVKKAGKEVWFAMPRIFRQRTAEQFDTAVNELKQLSFDGFLVRTYGQIRYLKRHFPSAVLVADHNLYTYNDISVQAFEECGLYNTVPLELNKKEIFHRKNCASEMIIYGRYPLMTSAQCVHSSTGSCDKTSGTCYLKDRHHMEFPVKNYCGACYNVIYNSLPAMLFSSLDELKKAGISDFRLDFTVEDNRQTEEILSLFQEFSEGKRQEYPKYFRNHYTNGHYKRGVE